VIFEYFGCDFPNQRNFSSNYLLSNGFDKVFVEVIFDQIAKKIIGGVAGRGMCAVVGG
jgi:hypothetical protein